MNAVTIESAPRRATKLGRAATSLYQYGETRHPRDCGCFSCLETRPLALRLSASDVDNIRWVFSELEGLVGLGSNFGHMCERIQQSQPPKPKPKTKSEHEPEHERGDISLVLADRRVREPRLSRQGVPVPLMHVRGTSYELRAYCSPLDAWCGPGISRRNPKSQSVHAAWLALSAMIGQGLTVEVITLYRMYGADSSRLLTAQFPDLGDLVVLAEDTDVVQEHLVKMTKILRRESRAQSFTVTPREAMADLLERRSGQHEATRTANVSTCRLQSHRLLVLASNAYRAARRTVG